MNGQSKERMIMSLEKRLAEVERVLGITPDPDTVINPRFNKRSPALPAKEGEDK